MTRLNLWCCIEISCCSLRSRFVMLESTDSEHHRLISREVEVVSWFHCSVRRLVELLLIKFDWMSESNYSLYLFYYWECSSSDWTQQTQQAQLPQRDSASAITHVFLGSLTDCALHWTQHLLYNRLAKLVSTHQLTNCATHARWVGHSRSFDVILVCAGRNSKRCVVLMCT